MVRPWTPLYRSLWARCHGVRNLSQNESSLEFYAERKRVADRLRDARKARNLSQQQLAALADTDQTFISNIESMKVNPSILTLFRLCDVLGIEPAWLLSNDA